MADIDSIQDFHSQLDLVCTSLEKLFDLAQQENEDLTAAAQPALYLFRQLLDVGASQGWAK